MRNGKGKLEVTYENCFYGLLPEEFGGPSCPCAIVEGDDGYYLCLIHEFRQFYPIHDAFDTFHEAVAFARGEFGTLRFQRVSLDDWAATPPGFMESLIQDEYLINAMLGNAS